MVFNLALSAGANTEFLNVFNGPTGPVAARSPGQFSRLVVPRNDSSVPTVNLFIDGLSPSMKYAASVVDACTDETTYALRCTSAPSFIGTSTCGPNAPVITVTEGPSFYRVSTVSVTKTLGYDVSATAQETCQLRGTTEAVCTATLGGSVDKTTTSTSMTSTASGSDYYRFNVAVTGGADKLANPSATCKPANSGASVKSVATWGLVGVVGVVSLLGL